MYHTFNWSVSAASSSHGVSEMKLYKIDSSQSQFTVHTDTASLLGAMGHKLQIAIQDFSGQIRIPSEKPELASLQMKVKSQSLTATDKISEKDKAEIEDTMQNKVLNTPTFSEITFSSSKVSGKQAKEGLFEIKITGDLTLHGVTRLMEIPTQVSIKANQLLATGEFRLKQTDFKIKPFSALGGAMKVKDELSLTFHLKAHTE
jgi:polyisoprenoid-binding protein YceI